MNGINLNEKAVIIATGENRIAGWLHELADPCIKKPQVFRYAGTESVLYSMLQPWTPTVFIEIGFFGEAMIGSLDRLRRQFPGLQIILFTVSSMLPEEASRYLYWSGGSFISLRDDPDLLKKQLNLILCGGRWIPDNMLREITVLKKLPDIDPHITHKESEVIRCAAQEKTQKETAHCLKISRSTVNKHLNSIYKKFGIRNMVGVLKLAVTQGILTEKELRSYRLMEK